MPFVLEVGSHRFVGIVPKQREELTNTSWLNRLSKSDKLLTKQFESDIAELARTNGVLQQLAGYDLGKVPPTYISLQELREGSLDIHTKGTPESFESITIGELAERFPKKLWQSIIKSSRELFNSSEVFCRKYGIVKSRKRQDLEILIPVAVHACAICFKIKTLGKNTKNRCIKCGSTDTVTEPVSLLSGTMSYFAGQNVWLEYGVSRLLRKNPIAKKGFEGYLWIGKSGVKHEIDVLLPTTPGTVGLVECTRSYVGLTEVMKVAEKVRDLGADFGLVFSVSRAAESAIRYGKSYNIHVFGEVLEDVKNTEDDIARTLDVIA